MSFGGSAIVLAVTTTVDGLRFDDSRNGAAGLAGSNTVEVSAEGEEDLMGGAAVGAWGLATVDLAELTALGAVRPKLLRT